MKNGCSLSARLRTANLSRLFFAPPPAYRLANCRARYFPAHRLARYFPANRLARYLPAYRLADQLPPYLPANYLTSDLPSNRLANHSSSDRLADQFSSDRLANEFSSDRLTNQSPGDRLSDGPPTARFRFFRYQIAVHCGIGVHSFLLVPGTISVVWTALFRAFERIIDDFLKGCKFARVRTRDVSKKREGLPGS
jgi:hypothetical protein